MKNKFKITCLVIAIIGLLSITTTAQEPSTVKAKSEVTIRLSYYKKADLSKTVVAQVKKNEDGKFVFAKKAKISFYSIHNNEQTLLNTLCTDHHGQAEISLSKDLPLDDSLYFTIAAIIENDSLYQDVKEQIHYKDASLSLVLDPLDTNRLVTAKVIEIGKDGKEKPVPGVEVKFFVKRLFGMMPASDENTITTDEKGEAAFTFPKNITGDTAGIITVAARIDDNEIFGNLENKSTQSWGTVLPIITEPFPRALFEPHAPLPLVITISTLFGGIWLIYFFIFNQLRKIKKEGTPSTNKVSV